jgi:hypothetical protein
MAKKGLSGYLLRRNPMNFLQRFEVENRRFEQGARVGAYRGISLIRKCIHH